MPADPGPISSSFSSDFKPYSLNQVQYSAAAVKSNSLNQSGIFKVEGRAYRITLKRGQEKIALDSEKWNHVAKEIVSILSKKSIFGASLEAAHIDEKKIKPAFLGTIPEGIQSEHINQGILHIEESVNEFPSFNNNNNQKAVKFAKTTEHFENIISIVNGLRQDAFPSNQSRPKSNANPLNQSAQVSQPSTQQFKQKLDHLSQQHGKESERLKQDYEEQLYNVRQQARQAQDAVQHLTQQYQANSSQLEQTYNYRVAAAMQQVNDANRSLQDLEHSYQKKFQDLQNTYSSDFQKLQKEANDKFLEMANLNVQYQTQIKNLHQAYSDLLLNANKAQPVNPQVKDKELQQKLDQLKQQYDTQLQQLQNAHDAAQSKLQTLTDQHEKNVVALKQQHQQAIEAKDLQITASKQKLQQLGQDHQAAIKNLEQNHARDLQKVQDQVSAFQKQIHDLQNKHLEEFQKLQKQYIDQFKDAKQKSEEQINNLTQYQNQLEKQLRDANTSLNDLNTKNAEKINNLENKHQLALQQKEEAHRAKLNDLHQQLVTSQGQLQQNQGSENDKKTLENRILQLQQQIIHLEKSHTENIQNLKEEHRLKFERLDREYHTQSQFAKQKIEDLEKELKQTKAQAEAFQLQLQEGFTLVLKQRDNEKSELNSQLKDAHDSINELKKIFNQNTAELEAQHAKTLQEKDTEHQTQLTTLKNFLLDLKNTLEENQQASELEKQALQDGIRQVQQQIESLKVSHSQEIDTLKQQHQLILEEAHSDYKAQIQDHQLNIQNLSNQLRQAQEQIEKLKNDYQMELYESQKRLQVKEQELKTLSSDYEGEIESLKQERATKFQDAQQQLDAKRQEIITLKQDHQNVIRSLKQDRDDRFKEVQDKLSASKKEKDILEQEYKKQIAKLNSQYKVQLYSAEQELQDMQNTLKAQQKQFQSELEGLKQDYEVKLATAQNSYQKEKESLILAFQQQLKNNFIKIQDLETNLENEKKDASLKIHQQKDDLEVSYTQRIEDLESNISRLEKLNQVLETELEQVKTIKYETETHYMNTKGSLNHKDKKNKKLNAQLDKLEFELGQLKSTRASEKNQYGLNLRALTSEKDQLATQIQDKEKEIKELKRKHRENIQTIEEQRNKITELSDDLEAKKSQNLHLTSTLQATYSKLESTSQENKNLKIEMDNMLQEIQNMRNDLASVQSIKDLNEDLSEQQKILKQNLETIKFLANFRLKHLQKLDNVDVNYSYHLIKQDIKKLESSIHAIPQFKDLSKRLVNEDWSDLPLRPFKSKIQNLSGNLSDLSFELDPEDQKLQQFIQAFHLPLVDVLNNMEKIVKAITNIQHGYKGDLEVNQQFSEFTDSHFNSLDDYNGILVDITNTYSTLSSDDINLIENLKKEILAEARDLHLLTQEKRRILNDTDSISQNDLKDLQKKSMKIAQSTQQIHDQVTSLLDRYPISV